MHSLVRQVHQADAERDKQDLPGTGPEIDAAMQAGDIQEAFRLLRQARQVDPWTTRAFLKEHTDVADVIEARIREAAGVSATPPGPSAEALEVDPETGEVLVADDAPEAKAA